MDSYICTIADLAYYENEKQIIVNVDYKDDMVSILSKLE